MDERLPTIDEKGKCLRGKLSLAKKKPAYAGRRVCVSFVWIFCFFCVEKGKPSKKANES